jgi:Fe-S-cluster-containing hydrogenase component 2
MKAISYINGTIVHDDEKCIGCGRCTVVCPEKASVMAIDDVNKAVDEILGRIKHRINVE